MSAGIQVHSKSANANSQAQLSWAASLPSYADKVDAIGRHTVRYGLVAVILYVAAMKFTAYEAQAISGLVSNSPLLAWVYQIFDIRTFGSIVGVSELAIAGMLAVRPWSAKLSAVGSVLAIGMFLTTLSFMFTTPGVVEASLGFPGLSVMPGQFLLKDVALLGIALWALGDSLKGIASCRKCNQV